MTSPRHADRIYLNGPILTMDDARPRVQALAIRAGAILAAGAESDVLALRGPDTEVVNLAGAALLPGFVDGHGHLTLVAERTGCCNVAAPPVGPVRTIADLQDQLRAFIIERDVRPGDWVIGNGYDEGLLAERRAPTRRDLDAVSTDHPLFVHHVSGHLAAANSRALAAARITAETPNPPGGVIRRVPGTREPDGVLEEQALAPFFTDVIPPPDRAEQMARLDEAQRIYASHGITTAQDGALSPVNQPALEQAAAEGRLLLDVVAYPIWARIAEMLDGRPTGVYRDHLKYGGMKIVLDGSPQAKTAWLTQPYHVPPPGRPPDYRGYPRMPDEAAHRFITDAYARGRQVIAHANGDAAADQFIYAVRAAAAAHPGPDRRPVMIHAQTAREDQLDAMAELGMIPSFFVSHVFYWGDWHRDSVLGPERAARISPLRSAATRGLRFNLHNDAPIVPPDILRLVWCAVVRHTRGGRVLGEDQRIDVMAALKAVTVDAAYAHFEEDRKGSLVPGRRADLVILSADPTAVDPMALPDIQVLETIKDGRTIYQRP